MCVCVCSVFIKNHDTQGFHLYSLEETLKLSRDQYGADFVPKQVFVLKKKNTMIKSTSNILVITRTKENCKRFFEKRF